MPTAALVLVLAAAAVSAAAPAQAPAPAPPGGVSQANVLAAAQPSGAFFALSVSNAAASARWYEEILGFRVFKRIDPPNEKVHIVLMENGGAILELIEHPAAKAPAAWHPDAKEPFLVRGYFKAGFRVAHLDRVLEALRAKKVEVQHGPFDIPEIKVRSFIVADPDGNLLQFFG